MRYDVDARGGTPYPTIASALAAAMGDSAAHIHVRAGAYREKLVVRTPGLRITGDGQAVTRIVWGDSAHLPDATGVRLGTFRTATLCLLADGVTLSGLTVENDAGPGEVVEQAVALYIAGDRCAVRHCALLAHQDTLFIGPSEPPIGDTAILGRRAYLADCHIRGNVDFIFGSYAVWLERCQLECVPRGQAVNAMICAPNTPQGQTFGFVFHRCAVTGGCAAGTVYLARPWRPFGRAAFLHCDLPACVSPAGWLDWETPPRPVWEGLCETMPAYPALRHPGGRILTDAEAAAITPQAVLAGEDGWAPQLI